MRLIKLSLLAATLISSSLFAIENTKVSGNAKLYYGTQDSDKAGSANLFAKDASYTNFAARLDLTTDLTKGISAGIGMQAVTTLGVEHNLVNSVWSNAHTARASSGATFHPALGGGLQVESAMWVDEVWLAGSALDTTLKIGRQALDTPLAFTERWGVDKNTFEAVVLMNQSIKDTTLVATFIGKSNGSADDRTNILGTGTNLLGLGAARAGYVATKGQFNTFGTQGTYAFGAINNSFKPLTLQAWYYDMVDLAKAYWAQADYKQSGFLAGAQLMNTKADGHSNDTTGYSGMLGYEIKDALTIKAAYSSVDKGGVLGVANTATGSFATLGGRSKLYTEGIWNFGNVSAQGSDSYSLTAETKLAYDVNLFGGIFYSDINNDNVATDKELTQVAARVSKAFGPLDTAIALIYADRDAKIDANDVKTTDIQLYLTYNF